MMPPKSQPACKIICKTASPTTCGITQTLDRVDENRGQQDWVYFRYHWQDITIVNGFNFRRQQLLRTDELAQNGRHWLQAHHQAELGERFPHRPEYSSLQQP